MSRGAGQREEETDTEQRQKAEEAKVGRSEVSRWGRRAGPGKRRGRWGQ